MEVQRGHGSTTAVRHASGVVAWVDEFKYFSSAPPEGEAVEADEPALPRIVLPGIFPRLTAWQPVNGSWVEVPTEALVNYYAVDPRTGHEYLRVQASAAISTAARWVAVTPAGQAAGSVAASIGMFGVNEAVRADEDYFFAQVGEDYEAPANGAGILTTSASVSNPVTPTASGAFTTQPTSADVAVFGVQVLRAATSTAKGRVFLTRPHTIGSVDVR